MSGWDLVRGWQKLLAFGLRGLVVFEGEGNCMGRYMHLQQEVVEGGQQWLGWQDTGCSRWCIAPETLLRSTLEVPFGCKIGGQLVLVIRGYVCTWQQSHPIDRTYSCHCLLSLSRCSSSVAILKLHSAGVVGSEFLVVVKEMERVREITFVMKCDWAILFLKEGKECVPVTELGWDEDMISGTFVHFRVVLGDAWNDEHVARQLETLNGLHHTS